MNTVSIEKHEFQAEVKQVLDIVVHSLYTDKEIFIRELVSNASDALEKLRHIQLSAESIFDENLNLEINLNTDENAGTITIQDFGIGMTSQEIVENIGTIAHSGSKAFLEAVKAKGQSNDNLIGQFGVGFYSVFMVAKEVKLFTHSWRAESEGLCWSSDGSGSYTIEPVQGQRRGCKIVVQLKDDDKEFSKSDRVKSILERYSNFVTFPINLNGVRINTIQALWLKNKNEISEDEYKSFYKFQSKAFDEPHSWLHFSVDAPLSIHALLFIPSHNPEKLGFGRTECGVALHCRKVLIDDKPKKLFPEWLRFLRGVVDSADLPLNISRESMQDSALMQKLSRVLTKRLLKHLEEMADKNPEQYADFWKNHAHYIKEGVVSDFQHREQLAKLLRFETSLTEKDKTTSLEEYIARMPSEQKEIYYLVATNRASIESGPYLEGFKSRNLELIYLYEAIDDFVMNNLGKFGDKDLVSAEQDDLKLPELAQESGEEPLDEASVQSLCDWMKGKLGDKKVSAVSSSNRLMGSPAIALSGDKMTSASMRRMMHAMNPDQAHENPSVHLQINPHHPLIKNLYRLKNEDAEVAQLITEQLHDNTLLSANLLENPCDMVTRTSKMLQRLSELKR